MFLLVAMMLPLQIKFNLLMNYVSNKCYFIRKILEMCWFKKKKSEERKA
jgi:hypothetical protein